MVKYLPSTNYTQQNSIKIEAGEVHAHHFVECRVLKTEHVGKVGRPVKLFLGSDDLAAVICVAVDERSNAGQLGDAVHGVLKGKLPIVLLVHTIAISLGEFGVLLQCHNSNRKGSHGVHALGKRKDEVLDPSWNV